MNLKEISSGRIEGYKIDPKLILVEEGFNFRIDSPELLAADEELKKSIIANGVQLPLTVRLKDDKVYVVNGHRRLKAVMAAIKEGVDIPTVPCINEPKGATDEDRVLMLLTTNSGVPPTALEKGAIFKRLSAMGWSNEKIGEKAGMSYKQVENLIGLQAAPAEIKEMISEGTLSASLAIKTMASEGKTEGAATLLAAAEKVRAEGGTKVTAKALTPKAPAAPPVITPPAPGLATGGLASLLNVGANPTPPVQMAQPPLPAPPAPEFDANGNRFPRLMNTPANFRELQDCLREILNVTDVTTIHIMVRDTLKVERDDTKAA